jgi:hypothetical protein
MSIQAELLLGGLERSAKSLVFDFEGVNLAAKPLGPISLLVTASNEIPLGFVVGCPVLGGKSSE